MPGRVFLDVKLPHEMVRLRSTYSLRIWLRRAPFRFRKVLQRAPGGVWPASLLLALSVAVFSVTAAASCFPRRPPRRPAQPDLDDLARPDARPAGLRPDARPAIRGLVRARRPAHGRLGPRRPSRRAPPADHFHVAGRQPAHPGLRQPARHAHRAGPPARPADPGRALAGLAGRLRIAHPPGGRCHFRRRRPRGTLGCRRAGRNRPASRRPQRRDIRNQHGVRRIARRRLLPLGARNLTPRRRRRSGRLPPPPPRCKRPSKPTPRNSAPRTPSGPCWPASCCPTCRAA